MKQIRKAGIMALAISIFFIACNNKEDTTESTTNESTSTATTTDATTQPQEMDAAKVASALYTVAKDTMGIRVLNILYKPGDSSAMHSHPDNALYVIDGGTGEFTEKDGSKQVADFKAGMTMISGAESHSVKNIGTSTLTGVLVEVNRPNQAANSHDVALDATKVASKFYKLVQDSLNIRIVMVDYKPGTSSALHSHPDLVMYVLEPAKAEFTAKDGTKQIMALDKGMIAVVPAATHSVKNIGNTNAKVVLIEVNRPKQ